MQSRSLFVGFVLAAPRAPVWKEREIAVGHALVLGSDEQEYVTPRDTRALSLEVHPCLLDA